jgi:hypothetical protein
MAARLAQKASAALAGKPANALISVRVRFRKKTASVAGFEKAASK